MKEAKLESDAKEERKPRTASAAERGLGSPWPRPDARVSRGRAHGDQAGHLAEFAQIRATTIVVIVTVFFFGVYFGILDWVFNNVVRRLLRLGSEKIIVANKPTSHGQALVHHPHLLRL